MLWSVVGWSAVGWVVVEGRWVERRWVERREGLSGDHSLEFGLERELADELLGQRLYSRSELGDELW